MTRQQLVLTLSFLGPLAVVDASFPLPLVPGRGRIDIGPRRGACNRHQILHADRLPYHMQVPCR